MDDLLQRLERAWTQTPGDLDLRADLARARLRAGDARGALALARGLPGDAGLREAAAAALGRALGLVWLGTTPVGAERYAEAGPDGAGPPAGGPGAAATWVLVPGGAVLDDGASSRASLLAGRSDRAPLRRVEVPDLLAAVRAAPAPAFDDALAAAATRGGRVPAPAEWKKLWRGGLFLDGDEAAAVPNPWPDRLVPDPDRPPEAAGPWCTPYGLEIEPAACEWLGPALGGVVERGGDRYHVPLATPADRRGRSLWVRAVREL